MLDLLQKPVHALLHVPSPAYHGGSDYDATEVVLKSWYPSEPPGGLIENTDCWSRLQSFWFTKSYVEHMLIPKQINKTRH